MWFSNSPGGFGLLASRKTGGTNCAGEELGAGRLQAIGVSVSPGIDITR